MAYRVARLAPEHRRDGAERDLRVRQHGLSVTAAAPARAGGSPGARPTDAARLPELHRAPIENTATSARSAWGRAGRDVVEHGRPRNRRARRSSSRSEPRTGRSRCPPTWLRRTVSAAAIARCSAPCRRSVRPRKSQRTIRPVVRIPAASSSRPGARRRRRGSSAARRKRRSRRRATPRPRTSGAIEDASWSRPRTSGIRCARPPHGHRALVQLTRVVANAQWRSLTITTPFGRAMPPSFGSESAASARASRSATGASTSRASQKKGRPASAGRPNPLHGQAY